MSASKRFSILILGVLALLLATPAAAQDNWFAYLLNETSPNQLIHVDLTGETRTIDLELSETSYVASIAFSSNGQLAAYCVGTMQSWATRFVVRDLEANVDLITLNFGEDRDCYVGKHAFNDSDTQVAIGSLTRSTYEWQLQILDVMTGSVISELNQELAAASGVEIAPFSMPATRAFSDNQLMFGMVFWGGESGAESDAYRWNIDDNQVEAVSGKWRYRTLDQLTETGEAIYPAIEPNLPAANPGGPMDANNVLMLEDATGEARIIYHNPDEVIAKAVFVDNGAKIAMWLIPNFDFEKPKPARWVMLDRQGNVEESGEYGSLGGTVMAAPAGMLMLWSDSQPDARLVARQLDYITETGTTTLWKGESERNIALVWANPVQAAAELPEFPTFTASNSG